MLIVSYISHFRPAHTSIFSWLGKLGRMGYTVKLLCDFRWQKIGEEIVNPLYPVYLQPIVEGCVWEDAPYFYVFFFNHMWLDKVAYEEIVRLPPPQRGAIFLFSSSGALIKHQHLLNALQEKWQHSNLSIYIYNLEDRMNVPFISFPPEALLRWEKKIPNAVLLTLAGFKGGEEDHPLIQKLCDVLAQKYFFPVVLDYEKAWCPPEGMQLPYKSLPFSLLGFIPFLSTFRWWIVVSDSNLPITCWSGIEALLAEICDVFLITNLTLPPSLQSLPVVRYVESLSPDTILFLIEETKKTIYQPLSFSAVCQKVNDGWQQIQELLGGRVKT